MASGRVRQSKAFINGRARGNSAVASCAGKRMYMTWTAAQKVAESMSRKGRAMGGRFSVYRCRYCQKFHVASRD